MTMIFSLHDSIAPNTAYEMDPIHTADASRTVPEHRHLIPEKTTPPAVEAAIGRPRLLNLLERSMERFPATLICGRSGTGKTTLAASFATTQTQVRWYRVDATDAEWWSFSRRFFACIEPQMATDGERTYLDAPRTGQSEIASYLAELFVNAYSGDSRPWLIVLDDIHHIFDAPWFDEFFILLLHSLPADAHLLLLCRSKPPGPLWRLRSKQMLNVLDEKVMAFDREETRALYRSLGLPVAAAEEARNRSFGRISKLLQIAGAS